MDKITMHLQDMGSNPGTVVTIHMYIDVLHNQLKQGKVYLDYSYKHNNPLIQNGVHHPNLTFDVLKPGVDLVIASPYRLVTIEHCFAGYECYDYYITIESIAVNPL